jgi:hypothetical protein
VKRKGWRSGGALALGLRQLVPLAPVYLIALIPFGIGVVLLLAPLINRPRS